MMRHYRRAGGRAVRLVLCAAPLAFALAALPAAAETLVERGAYLMKGIVACGNCHTMPGGPMAAHELSGGQKFGERAFTVFAPNITPDPETGIGGWTDDQLVAAIRDGKKPDGSLVRPPMPIPFYRSMSDRDVRAIVAYIRTVAPTRNAVTREAVYNIPLPPSYGPPVGAVPDVPKTDKIAYGRYLAYIGHCLECHTPLGPQGRDLSRAGAGGEKFEGPWGTSVSANITPDAETGLGKWSDADIKRAITTGTRPDGTKLNPPMGFAYYKNIADDDLDALIAFLRSLKPINNKTR
jgi:mono/diheme cytochrome c family protein